MCSCFRSNSRFNLASLTVLLLLLRIGPSSRATVWQVDDDLAQFPKAKFKTIQPAVDAAKNGDTIQVAPGVYAEGVTVNKTLKLLGAQAGVDARTRQVKVPQESLIVAGQHHFNLSANDIIMDGFSLRVVVDDSGEGVGAHTRQTFSGYRIINNIMDADGTTALVPECSGAKQMQIRRNLFTGRLGIAVESNEQGEAHNVLVEENLFIGSDLAFFGNAHSDLLITRNKLTDGGRIAISDNSFPSGFPPSVRVQVLKNELSGPGSGLMEFRNVEESLVKENVLSNAGGDGIVVSASSNIKLRIEKNRIFGSSGGSRVGTGIRFDDAALVGLGSIAVSLVEIIQNDIRGFGVGLEIFGNGNFIQGNSVQDNQEAGISIRAGSHNNLVFGNETRGSATDCFDETTGGAQTFTTLNTWFQNEGSSSFPDGLCIDSLDQTKLGSNLLRNSDLKKGTPPLPESWTPDAYAFSASFFNWDKGNGILFLNVPEAAPNDTRWTQVVTVTSHTDYLLEASISTENVAYSNDLVDGGANLSILETDFIPFDASAPLLGDQPFTRRMVWFNSGDRTSVTVALRLGIYSGTTSGQAAFKAPKLRKITQQN